MRIKTTWGWVCWTYLFLASLYAGPPPASPTATATPLSMNDQAADLAMRGSMKSHFRKGMRSFLHRKYDEAIPQLMAATMIADPTTWNYWYAEAYATLGVIYEFYRSEPGHAQRAYRYYCQALQRDPRTKTALHFIGRVRPHQLEPH